MGASRRLVRGSPPKLGATCLAKRTPARHSNRGSAPVRTTEQGLRPVKDPSRTRRGRSPVKLSKGRLGLLLVAAGLLVLGGAAAGVYAQSTSTVVMTEFAFNPSRLVVSA